MARKPKTNDNGLTQSEFLAAVGPVPILELRKMEQAWLAGDDPSDWRAHYAAKEAPR